LCGQFPVVTAHRSCCSLPTAILCSSTACGWLPDTMPDLQMLTKHTTALPRHWTVAAHASGGLGCAAEASGANRDIGVEQVERSEVAGA